MSYGVNDYPEPKGEPVQGVCPYCGRPFDRYIWYIDGEPSCDECLKAHIKGNYSLRELAEALGIPFRMAEETDYDR